MDFRTTEQCRQGPFLASPLVKSKSGTSIFLGEMPFQFLQVQHVSFLLPSGVTFRQAPLNYRVKKEQEKILKFLYCFGLPAGSFQDPFSSSLRLADLGPIVKSLHWTSMAPDPFAIFTPSCKPQDTSDICHGETKCPKIMTEIKLEEEPLCTKIWLVFIPTEADFITLK